MHRLAIDALNNSLVYLETWWRDRYRVPGKPFEDHSFEELYLERLISFYYEHPDEIKKTLQNLVYDDDDWDGELSDEEEDRVQAWASRRKVDLSKYQSDEEVTEEEEERIIRSLGTNSPGEDPHEFEENFEE